MRVLSLGTEQELLQFHRPDVTGIMCLTTGKVICGLPVIVGGRSRLTTIFPS